MEERSESYGDFLPSVTEVRFFVSLTNELESSSEGQREWSVGGRGSFGTREIERGGCGRELDSVLVSRVFLGSKREREVSLGRVHWLGRAVERCRGTLVGQGRVQTSRSEGGELGLGNGEKT